MRHTRFFESLISQLSLTPSDRGLLLVTHMLPDRPAFISALQKLFSPVTVVAIPYSVDPSVLARCTSPVLTPSMSELDSEAWAWETFEAVANVPTVVVEIGGYFSCLAQAGLAHPLLVGCVEDTEAGHRRYSSKSLGVPVVSVARSPLKASEDILVGDSLAYTVERVARLRSSVLAGMSVSIVGFGKIGESLSLQLRSRGARVSVVEQSASRALRAVAHGFQVLDHRTALSGADAVVACTGRSSFQVSDLEFLKEGCLLFSGSSRQVEYEQILSEVEQSEGRLSDLFVDDRHVYLVDRGFPANFVDGAEIGPILRAPQAELIVGSAIVQDYDPGINEVPGRLREAIANIWRRSFLDSTRVALDDVQGDWHESPL